MVNSKRWAERAYERVVYLIEVAEFVTEDNVITREERRMLVAAAHDARATARVADKVDAFGRGVGRASSSRQIGDIARACQMAMDEVPDPLTAA